MGYISIQEIDKKLVRKMNIFRSYNNWRRYRNTVNELSRLSTRELNDLGILPADIPYVARKASIR